MQGRVQVPWGAAYLVLFLGFCLIAVPGIFAWNLIQAGGDLSAEVWYGSKWGWQSLADVLPALVLLMPIILVAEILAVRQLASLVRRSAREKERSTRESADPNA